MRLDEKSNGAVDGSTAPLLNAHGPATRVSTKNGYGAVLRV